MDRKLHLCFVTPEYALRPPFGGIATHTRAMAQWLAKRGHVVHVVCLTRTQAPSVEQDGDVHVHFVAPTRVKPRRVLAYISAVPGLRRIKEAYYAWDLVENSVGAWRTVRSLEREHSFDLIQCSDFGGLAFRGIWPFKGRRTVLLRGNSLISMSPVSISLPGGHFQHFLERLCASRADFILTASSYLAAKYQSEFGTADERLGVLYRPYDVINEINTLAAIPANGQEINVLYVGRFEEKYKGSDILLEALRLVRERGSDIKAHLVGEVREEFQDQFYTFLQANSSWVTYYGSSDQRGVLQRMLQSDMLVLPSRHETAGGVLVEAQFCALAQVASRVGGIPELVKHGVTGLLVEPENPVALADAIIELCESPEKRKELGRQSRELAHRRFDIDATMNAYLRVVEALIDKNDPRPVLQAALGLSADQSLIGYG